jgi:hypothetical protein
MESGYIMTTIIRDSEFSEIARNVKPDSKKRVGLGTLVEKDVIYHVYVNNSGQIVLDPQVTIPASEAWVFQNPEILSLVKKGLSEAAEDKFSEIDLDTL